MNPAWLGVYWCKITQLDPKKKNVLPFRATTYERKIVIQETEFEMYKAIPGKPLDWKFKGSFYAYVNSVDISSVWKAFGEESVEVFKGIEWESTAHGSIVFPFMKFWKDVKN